MEELRTRQKRGKAMVIINHRQGNRSLAVAAR